MTPEEVLDNFGNFIVELPENVEQILGRIATNSKAVIQDRVQNNGVGSDGRPFSPYSSNKIPAYIYTLNGNPWKSSTISTIERMIKDNPSLELSYKDVKQLDGKYTGKVDLTLSGDMWRNIGLQETGSDGDDVFAVIAGGRQETKDKLSGNNARRPGILALTDQEEEQAGEDFEEEIGNLIDKYFDRTGS